MELLPEYLGDFISVRICRVGNYSEKITETFYLEITKDLVISWVFFLLLVKDTSGSTLCSL